MRRWQLKLDDTGSVQGIYAFIYCTKWRSGQVLPMPHSLTDFERSSYSAPYKSGALVTQWFYETTGFVRKNLLSQQGAVLHWQFPDKVALFGCNSFLHFGTEIGRNSITPRNSRRSRINKRRNYGNVWQSWNSLIPFLQLLMNLATFKALVNTWQI